MEVVSSVVDFGLIQARRRQIRKGSKVLASKQVGELNHVRLNGLDRLAAEIRCQAYRINGVPQTTRSICDIVASHGYHFHIRSLQTSYKS